MAEKKRPLTAGEIALLDEAFRGRIRYEKVRLSNGSGSNPIPMVALRTPKTDAITVGNTIYFGANYFDDFSAAHTNAKGLLLHEMTHVWQWARLGKPRFLTRYAKEFIACRGDRAKMYAYTPGDAFDRARLEAQADMIRDYGKGHIEKNAAAMKKYAPSLAATGLYGL